MCFCLGNIFDVVLNCILRNCVHFIRLHNSVRQRQRKIVKGKNGDCESEFKLIWFCPPKCDQQGSIINYFVYFFSVWRLYKVLCLLCTSAINSIGGLWYLLFKILQAYCIIAV